MFILSKKIIKSRNLWTSPNAFLPQLLLHFLDQYCDQRLAAFDDSDNLHSTKYFISLNDRPQLNYIKKKTKENKLIFGGNELVFKCHFFVWNSRFGIKHGREFST